MLNEHNELQNIIREKIISLAAVRAARIKCLEMKALHYAMRQTMHVVVSAAAPQLEFDHLRFVNEQEIDVISKLMDYACVRGRISFERLERDLYRTFDVKHVEELTGNQFGPVTEYLDSWIAA